MSNSNFTLHKRKGLSEMRPYELGEDLTGVSVSDADKQLSTLEEGWIARNPVNHEERWYVAKSYYEQNLEPVNSPIGASENVQALTFGERLVGIRFNPSNDDRVLFAKSLFAQAANMVEATAKEVPNASYEFNLIKGNALHEIINGQMNVVKLLTWKD